MVSSRTPVVLVTGIDEDVMAGVTLALQWDLPSAVSVRHEVDPDREVLIRIVADVDGLIERTEFNVAHACVSCAIREDVVPTLERLAASGRWSAVVAQLPVTAESVQVCRYLESAPSAFAHVAITAAVVALDSDTIRADLLGDDLLIERGLRVRPEDVRGVAEVACAMVEYADLVALSGPVEPAEAELTATIARPGVAIMESASIDAATLLAGLHRHDESEAWVHVVRREELTFSPSAGTWVLDFRSDRPFHPQRLRDRIEALGRGSRRSRGCFWLPSRPGQVCQWDGAGGMVSIGPPLAGITPSSSPGSSSWAWMTRAPSLPTSSSRAYSPTPSWPIEGRSGRSPTTGSSPGLVRCPGADGTPAR